MGTWFYDTVIRRNFLDASTAVQKVQYPIDVDQRLSVKSRVQPQTNLPLAGRGQPPLAGVSPTVSLTTPFPLNLTRTQPPPTTEPFVSSENNPIQARLLALQPRETVTRVTGPFAELSAPNAAKAFAEARGVKIIEGTIIPLQPPGQPAQVSTAWLSTRFNFPLQPPAAMGQATFESNPFAQLHPEQPSVAVGDPLQRNNSGGGVPMFLGNPQGGQQENPDRRKGQQLSQLA